VRDTLPTPRSTATPAPPTEVTPARAGVAGDRYFIEYGESRWEFLSGVNLGVTVPGRYPGELAVDAATYRRWFPMMSDLGIRSVRVYTIQPPHFYEELRAYNLAHPDDPLFVVHGVWIDEERLLATADLFDEALTADFTAELTAAVNAVAGDLELPARPGHASGSFTADVTPWLVGWIIGIELDPVSIAASDATNATQRLFNGTWFSAKPEATPTASWFAARLDHLAGELAARNLAMPLAFTNWPTTDPLHHPYEPIANEDLVGIDPNNVTPEAWDGGYFASYHAYPYYPDFQRFDPELLSYQFAGRADPYAGYLEQLRDHHRGLPVVIAEFGVPGGMALAHEAPLGRHQGAHSEPDQMALNAEMLELIRAQGLAGGLVFEWADEWFKRTWNTVDLEQPADRRALWTNAFNNESQFGLLAVDPGSGEAIRLDGSPGDWDQMEATPIFQGEGAVRGILATHDARFLYLGLFLDETLADSDDPIAIGFDVIAGGSGGLPGSGAQPEADAAVVLGPGTAAEALVRASNDPFGIRFALVAGYFPAEPADYEPSSGVWNEQRLLTSYPLTVATTGETVPAETFPAGHLVYGSTDPNAADYDSRAAWYRRGSLVELRVPYAVMSVADPSSRQALVVAADGTITTAPFERVGISVVVADQVHRTAGYTWEPWNAVEWHDRLKVGVEVIREAMANPSGR
jgi:hypothetical protein